MKTMYVFSDFDVFVICIAAMMVCLLVGYICYRVAQRKSREKE